jgi:putative ABC transport system ATP-binding protein
MGNKPIIKLSQICKEYEGKRQLRALDSIDLEIDSGEIVAIMGPSGSGKSTLLNLIGGLDHPTSGFVEVEGENLSRLSDKALTLKRRDKIGFVFQFFNLLPTLSALENVAIPLHLRGWSRARTLERARELLTLVDLENRLSHLPDELSGGERQRVAIARALSIYPPILLADEPTGNLDSKTGDQIMALLREVHRRFHSAIIIVTHNQEIANSCSRLVTLQDGRVLSDTAVHQSRQATVN